MELRIRSSSPLLSTLTEKLDGKRMGNYTEMAAPRLSALMVALFIANMAKYIEMTDQLLLAMSTASYGTAMEKRSSLVLNSNGIALIIGLSIQPNNWSMITFTRI